jgi:hypothetical protein
MWQEGVHISAGNSQHPRQHRRRTLAIDIVVAVYEDAIARADRLANHVDGVGHASKGQWISEGIQARTEKGARGCGVGVTALHQDGRERKRHSD